MDIVSETEQDIQRKIKTATLVAKVCLFCGFLFVGFGAAYRVMTGDPKSTSLMIVGLVFLALMAVALCAKRTLLNRIESGKTFYQKG